MPKIKSGLGLLRPLLRSLGCLATIWFCLVVPSQALAQMLPSSEPVATTVEIPEDLTQEQVRDLVARLSDGQVRELIISQLDKNALVADQPTNANLYFEQLNAGLTTTWGAVSRMFDTTQQLYALPSMIWQGISDEGNISTGYLIFQLIGLLVVGFAVERIAKRLLEKATTRATSVEPIGKRFDLACYGAALGLVEIGAFAVGAILFVKITGTYTDAAQTLWYQVIWCLLLIKLVLLAVQQIAVPASAETGLVPLTDSVARQIWGWSLVLTSSLVLPLPLITVARDFGASAETALLIRVLLGLFFLAFLIGLVIRLRHYGAQLIAGNDAASGSIREGLARIWWMLTIVYILLIWLMSIGKHAATGESSLVPGMGSLMLFALIPYLDKGLQWLITHYFEVKEEETALEEVPGADGLNAAIPAAATLIEPGSSAAPAPDADGINETNPVAATLVEPYTSVALAPDTNVEFAPETGADLEPDTSTDVEPDSIEDIEPDTSVASEPEISTDFEPIAADIEPGYIATALGYARVLMVLALLAIFLRLWQIDIEAISATLVGERFASALFDISLTVLLAWALWGVIRISIERKLSAEKGGPGAEQEEAEIGGLGGTRVETILPIVRFFIKITLITMAVMVSLSALGVNIGPLIAGAGVVGIAIGFGAQTLVRDVVSGLFFLIDDAFRIGEYVEMDQIRGSVERISVRSFQLRHHNGPVHTIPYGEIRSLTNYSRDWAIMKFELRIPFETDIDLVRRLIKKVGLEMIEDPVFGHNMMQPLKSQGVNRMDDSALIIRCKFTAVPGQQFLIRREAFTRIQRAFEENGIHFAPRRVLVEAATPKEAMQAAAAVIDQEEDGKK